MPQLPHRLGLDLACYLAPGIAGALAAVFSRPGLVDVERPALQVRPVQAANGLLRGVVVGHFDETEPARSARLTVRDHLRAHDLPKGGKGITQLVVARVETEVANENSNLMLLKSSFARWLGGTSGIPAYRTREAHR